MTRSNLFKHLALCAGLMFCSAVLTHGAVSFEQGPVVKGKRVGFVLSEPSDVEVAVLDAEGEIVRHLAAGVLGGQNPPPAPLQPGLKQILDWDGKDDEGNPAQGGPFSFRVRAGIKPKFDGFPLQNPHASGALFTVAVGPGGLVYAFHKHATANGNMGSHDIKIYSREGRFVRTLKPFAASIPQERVKATGAFEDDEGRVVPRIDNWEQLGFYPDPISNRGRSMPDAAKPAAVDANGRVYWVASGKRTGPRLLALDADGGLVYDDFLGPNILPDSLLDDKGKRKDIIFTHSANLAVSSDGKHVYLSGLIKGYYKHHRRPEPAVVVRVPVADRTKGEIFVGNAEKVGTKGALLSEPRGVAAANGLLYVADKKANRVVVFHEKDGSLADEFAVPKPDTIGVDPESGAVYVLSNPGRKARIIKFDNHGKELYKTKLPESRGKQRIAVDASVKPVRIWLPSMHYGPAFTCVEDTGDSFKVLGDPRPKGPRNGGPRDLSYDRVRDELYVKISGERWHRICGKTHKILKTFSFGATFEMGAYATQLLAREDGNLVTLSYSPKRAMRLWTRDAKPLNWPGHDSNQATTWGGIMTFTQNYMALHDDEIFFIPPGHYKNVKGKKWRFSSLNVMGYDRKERRTAIWQVTRGSIPRVDAQGNIYLATMVRDPEQPLPKFFDDKLPPLKDKMSFSSEYWYSYMYGGIVKFPPEGGSVWHKEGEIPGSVVGAMPEKLKDAPKTEIGYHYYYNTKEKGSLQNAEWYRSGFAPYSETYPAGTPSCMCEGAGFDVDGWGRVFYPNLGQYRVEFIDNNNNWIGTFGHYGNEDSIGNGKAIETAYQHESDRAHPDIPLAWPTYVAVSDTHAYVNDTLSRRVVAVRLDAEVSETISIE